MSLQPRYSLVARDIETDVLPTCQRQGLGTLVYSPLGGGVLTGKYGRGQRPEPDTRYGRAASDPRRQQWAAQVLADRNFDIAEAVEKVAAELGTTPTAVALAWVLSRRGVTSAIIGPRTLAQYEENEAGFALELEPEMIHRLNDVSRPR